MTFNILTLFTDFFQSPFKSGLLGKAIDTEIIDINIIDIRSFSEDKHNRCDDYPYGGGAGMVLKPEPLFRALQSIHRDNSLTIATSPGGRQLDQRLVKSLSNEKELNIICGHYEGIDQRVIDAFVDFEISIGDYILSGGEFAALVLIDTIARYIPGFMSNSESVSEESFEKNLLEYPHYTRPAEYEGLKVPEILLSGHHKEIEKWRLSKRIEKTKQERPDLYENFLKSKIDEES